MKDELYNMYQKIGWDRAISDILKLEGRVKRDLEIIQWYADPNNWEWENNSIDDKELIGYYEDEDGETFQHDPLCKEEEMEFRDYICGFRARQRLKEIENEKLDNTQGLIP